VLGVCIFCKKHDVAVGSAWVDDICATPNIVCSEVKATELVLIYVVIFKENKFVSITIVGGAIANVIEDRSKIWMPQTACSFLLKHILYARKYVVAQLYEEVLFWSCLVDKNGREVQGRLP
jgi:hypothetical protein